MTSPIRDASSQTLSHQESFYASSGFRQCLRNGKYSAGIVSSRIHGTEADKVAVFGFPGSVYMKLFSRFRGLCCGGNMWCIWNAVRRTVRVRVQIMLLLVCCMIAVVTAEHYGMQAQVMSSKAFRASNTRSNGESGDTVSSKRNLRRTVKLSECLCVTYDIKSVSTC